MSSIVSVKFAVQILYPGMKYLPAFIVLFCFSLGNVNAQFTLTVDDHIPSIGDEVHYTNHINSDDTLDVMTGGPGQMWDFSGMEGGVQLTYQYAASASGVFPDDYPNADYVEIGLGYANGGYTAAESYYTEGAQGVSQVGSFITGYGKVDYSPPRLVFPFPMDYGDVASNSWEAIGYNWETGTEDERIGDTEYEYDGYGTLMLPHITLNDVVRLRQTSEQVIDLNGFEVTFRDTIFLWFSNDYNHYVASYIKAGYVDLGGESVSIHYIRDEDEIIHFPTLAIEASIDTACAGDCFTFNNLTEDTIIDNATDVSWNWSFPGGSPDTANVENPGEVCYQTPGTYDVILEVEIDTLSFSQTFPNFVTVLDSCGPVANFNYTPIVCLGQCYDFESTSINATQFFWTFEGAANPISEEEHPTEICYLDETGIFNVTLTVMNENGSSTSITQQVSVVNPSNLNAGSDQTITQGNATVLSAFAGSGTGDFIWQPFELVNCFSCATTNTTPLQETTTFVVYYEESGGCQVSDTVTVFVEESLGFGIPNSFSPNDDGTNDVLYVRGNNITRMHLMLFNRYGEKVFETKDQLEGWDGTINGRQLDAGVFGYHLEVFQSDGSRNMVKGDVTLVR